MHNHEERLNEKGCKLEIHYQTQMPLLGWVAAVFLQTLDYLGVHPSGYHQKLGLTSLEQKCRCRQSPQPPRLIYA